jgi:hypothetical protein
MPTPQVFVSPTMPGDPRLDYHRGTRGLSSTVSLESFNSTNNIKKGTISSKNRTNNIIDTQREENSPQNAPIRNPITNQNINDTNDNIIDTQREENSPHVPIGRTLRTRATTKKQAHKMNTTVYRIFCDDGGLHQGYICGFDTKEGYYKIKYQDGDIEEATEEEIDRMIKNLTKHPWHGHYQQPDLIESMNNTVKQYQGCQLHLNFQMNSEKQ